MAAAAEDNSGKLFWSYEQIQSLVRHAVLEQDIFQEFQPTLIICIAAGG
jgi:hypoxanthine phosphoribosyltransferase